MERKQLIEGMKGYTGGALFISRKQLAEFLGYADPHYVDQYTEGVGKIGRCKMFIPDIAKNILKMQS